MQRIIENPWGSLGAGFAAAIVVLLVWVAAAGSDGVGFLSFLLRWVHVVAAMVWVGLIVFVNFIQLIAMRAADERARDFMHISVVPQVALWFRHASTLVVASGVLLAVLAGYLLPGLIYGTGVYMPPERASLLWLGVLGGLAMWMLVHMYIWPSLRIALGLRPGDEAGRAAARDRVRLFARLNLIIAVPVTLAMVAAAHL
jgi:uncharacterized membrane protein